MEPARHVVSFPDLPPHAEPPFRAGIAYELNPFGEVRAPHLHGYLVAERGEFRLEPLGRDRTLVAGTTWYRHGLWPDSYWTLWSDPLIHRIHARALAHVKTLAEEEQRRGDPASAGAPS